MAGQIRLGPPNLRGRSSTGEHPPCKREMPVRFRSVSTMPASSRRWAQRTVNPSSPDLGGSIPLAGTKLDPARHSVSVRRAVLETARCRFDSCPGSHSTRSAPSWRATERFAAIVEPVRRLVANEEIAGAEPAGRSRLPPACRSKADRPLDKGQTVERYHARRPSGGRRQRDEPSGCDPELSRCESGRSPQRFRAQGKTASRQLGVLEVAGARPVFARVGQQQTASATWKRRRCDSSRGHQAPVSDNGSPRSW